MDKRLIRLGKENINAIVDSYDEICVKYLKIATEKNLSGKLVMKTINKNVIIFIEIDGLDEYSIVI